MAKKSKSSVDMEDIKEAFNEQSEEVKEKYRDWVELNRTLWLETIKAFDAQAEMWLSMQLGYLDMMNNFIDSGPDFKGLAGSSLNPFLGQLEYLRTMNKQAMDNRKNEAEKIIRTLREQHKKTIQTTIDAFDKYCDLITSV